MIKTEKHNYWKSVVLAYSSLLQGLKLSMRHFLQARSRRKPFGISNSEYFDQKTGRITLQYPRESIPVPDNGRYQLHNEIEDCIVCDKCVKICPVDCIDIDPIRSAESFGETSDGTTKRIYAAKFDIDMAKCCFCGLCTTVCPTECLTMTGNYDFSAFDFKDHNFSFADMTAESIKQKQMEWDEHLVKKEAVKKQKEEEFAKGNAHTNFNKPVFRPKVRPNPADNTDAQTKALELMKNKKPVFKPKIKPNISHIEGSTKAKPIFRPKVKPVIKKENPKLPPKEGSEENK